MRSFFGSRQMTLSVLSRNPHKIAALTGLLQQFGLQAVTQLRTEQMGPFVLALRGMGARI